MRISELVCLSVNGNNFVNVPDGFVFENSLSVRIAKWLPAIEENVYQPCVRISVYNRSEGIAQLILALSR